MVEQMGARGSLGGDELDSVSLNSHAPHAGGRQTITVICRKDGLPYYNRIIPRPPEWQQTPHNFYGLSALKRDC